MIIITYLLFLLISLEGLKMLIFGSFISKSKQEEWILNFNNQDKRINFLDHQILSTTPFISILPIPTFSKYYINDIGQVPRWSKLHKIINQWFNELNNK